MAELAAGAVSSLLLVIRNESLLLGGVQDDVQFIKEEMESMNSFLAHLARSAPPGGEHDEQVRTWMTQVRVLAHDCNNCIDLYLYSGNPDIHRAKGRLRRYLWWVYWFLRKLIAQHQAAVQLRQLKDRARDVGERRLRYGVEVPAKSASGLMLSSSAKSAAAAGGYAAGDDEEDSENQLAVATTTRTLDDHVKAKLLKWFHEIPPNACDTFSIAIIVEPDTYQEALALARDTLAVPPARGRAGYHRDIIVDIPMVHLRYLPLRPKEVLYYILRELKYAKSQSQKPGIDQGEGEEEGDRWQDHFKRTCIYFEKKKELRKVKGNIKIMKIDEKLDKIKRDIQGKQKMVEGNQQKLLHQGVDQLDLDVLLLLLLQSTAASSQQDQHKLPAWDNDIISKIAKKLKKHMEEDEAGELKEQMGVEDEEETTKQGGGEEDVEEKRNEMEKEEDRKEEEKGEEDRKEEEKGEEDRKEEDEHKGEETEEEEEKVKEDRKEEDEHKEEEMEEEEEEEKGEDRKEENGHYKEEEIEEEDQEEEEDEEEDDDTCYEEGPISLHEDQYAQILREVFPKTSSSKSQEAEQQDRSASKQATKATTIALNQEQIKQIIHETKQEVLRELQQGKPDKDQATSKLGVPCQNQEADFEEIVQKISEIRHKLKEQLKINWLVHKIKHHLMGECPLIILKVDKMMDGSRWEEIRQALSLLECSADAVIFTTSTQQAKGYYYQPREPVYYSLVGLYHDTVLELTNQQKNDENYNPQVFRDILEVCEPHEFCMKIFTHDLYANPKRSNEELIKLHRTLKASQKSSDILAKKMFMYSYNDLPKEYKSCLLYLAIFPRGQKIRRSTLIERWVVEGLTLEEDWPSSVRQAHRCFNALIHRWLVYPDEIGATGKVKSCVVGDLVHGFITAIARKQHFVETRLSHHLARHFSIFNDIKLRSSDTIENFFQGRSKSSSRVSLLKVLDLEGCQCFSGKNQRYLKDICTKMLLLKYLSLRGTDSTQLPSEINYLRELEVLDIRQTKVPASATANILLLKLKRLLAGHIDPRSSNFGSVRVPHRIDKMANIEVLSNVKVRHSHDLKDIGKLWQLRKLGVVIENQDRHLSHLLQTISDLHECLRSLSITTLPQATPHEGTPSSVEFPGSRLRHHPKILESLSISGTTLTGHLRSVITGGNDEISQKAGGGNDKLAKVTLGHTLLNEDDLDVLAKQPKLRCVRLRNIACTECKLTFKEGEFISLKYLLVEGSELTEINFMDGAARELEKMVLSFTRAGSISGVDKLPKLEELELNGDECGKLLPSFDSAKQIAKLTLCGTLLKQDALQILAKKPNIRCLVLLDKSFLGHQNQITFNKDEFKWLNLLVVGCSSITEVVFTNESAPRLEKIIWPSSTTISGIDKLPRLKELEFNGVNVPNKVTQDIENHKNKPSLKLNGPETQDQAKGDEEDDHDAVRFPCCWKKQV